MYFVSIVIHRLSVWPTYRLYANFSPRIKTNVPNVRLIGLMIMLFLVYGSLPANTHCCSNRHSAGCHCICLVNPHTFPSWIPIYPPPPSRGGGFLCDSFGSSLMTAATEKLFLLRAVYASSILITAPLRCFPSVGDRQLL